jgi:hypothetical protein
MIDRTEPRDVTRDTYPRPEYQYPDVKIGTTYKESTSDFPPMMHQAPAGAPNVVLVLLDDVGYAWPRASRCDA